MSAPDPGRIDIRLTLSGGIVRSVDILSRRPTAIGRWFAGRPAGTVAPSAGLLFALCGRSHQVAAEIAVAMAEGGAVARERLVQLVRLLAAERLFEHLRPLATGQIPRALGRPLREDGAGRLTAMAALAARLRQAPDAPGLVGEIRGLLDQSVLFAHLADIAADIPGTADRLEAADDAAVVAALAADPAFAATPSLPGRTPEAGPAARRATANRMAARLIEIVEALDILAGDRLIRVDDWLACHAPAPGLGCGMVESPRGRLAYLVETGPSGAVVRLDVLAPTEWNFAAGGPLARLLIGRAAPGVEEAEAFGLKAASLMDPCVDFAGEAVHA